MSIRESLGHLIVDDRAALESVQTGEEPDYDSISKEEMQSERLADLGALLERLNRSHEALCGHLDSTYGNSALDTPICIWGNLKKLAVGIPYLSSEDFYHAGQAAFIRMATDPSWDYYTAIYGPV